MNVNTIIIVGLTISFLALILEMRLHKAKSIKVAIYKLCEVYLEKYGEDNFELFQKLPSSWSMVLSGKPMVLSNWYTTEESAKILRMLTTLDK